jgi:DNA-binding transcriptional regulator LsrR (DeoR family)
VGDICSRFFAIDGSPCRTPIAGRVVGIELADLRRIPSVIGVAVGPEKAAPIAGALRGGYVSILVTDAPTAREALRITAGGAADARSAGIRPAAGSAGGAR